MVTCWNCRSHYCLRWASNYGYNGIHTEKTTSPGEVTYCARIRLKGAPEMSESFLNRKKAKEWAARMESEIKAGR